MRRNHALRTSPECAKFFCKNAINHKRGQQRTQLQPQDLAKECGIWNVECGIHSKMSNQVSLHEGRQRTLFLPQGLAKESVKAELSVDSRATGQTPDRGVEDGGKDPDAVQRKQTPQCLYGLGVTGHPWLSFFFPRTFSFFRPKERKTAVLVSCRTQRLIEWLQLTLQLARHVLKERKTAVLVSCRTQRITKPTGDRRYC